MNFRGVYPNFIIGVELLPTLYQVSGFAYLNLENSQGWRLPSLSG